MRNKRPPVLFKTHPNGPRSARRNSGRMQYMTREMFAKLAIVQKLYEPAVPVNK